MRIEQTVVLQWCRTDDDYESGLRSIWGSNTDIVVVEHDIQADQQHIDELLRCPAPLCAFAYDVYPVTTGLDRPVIAHLNASEYGYDWISPGDHWADHAALGLTKLGRLARAFVKDWAADETDAKGSWRNLDTRISKAMSKERLKYHIHWPKVEHVHQ